MDDVIVLQSAALTLEHGTKKRLEAVQVRRRSKMSARVDDCGRDAGDRSRVDRYEIRKARREC